MYCGRCGNNLREGDLFCGKCGAKTAVNDPPQQAAVPPQPDAGQQWNVPPTPGQSAPHQNAPGRAAISVPRKPGAVQEIISIAIGVLAVILVISFFVKDNVDYIQTVKNMTPVATSTATYEDLINDYFDSPRWKDRKGKDGVVYVDISGTPKNGDEDIMLTIRLDPTDDPDYFWITPDRIIINNRGSGEDEAGNFVYQLYLSYTYGSDMVDLYNLFNFFSAFS